MVSGVKAAHFGCRGRDPRFDGGLGSYTMQMVFGRSMAMLGALIEVDQPRLSGITTGTIIAAMVVLEDAIPLGRWGGRSLEPGPSQPGYLRQANGKAGSFFPTVKHGNHEGGWGV